MSPPTELRVEAVLDTAVDAIISIDERGCIGLFNKSAERMFGYSAEEVQGKNVKILMPEPYSSAHDGYLHNYLTTHVKKIIGIGREVVALRKDGSTFPIDLAVGEDTGNPAHRFVGFIRDISDRMRDEAQIREQASLINLLREAIFVFTLDGRNTFWNRGAEQLYGQTADQALGQRAVDIVRPTDLVQFEEARQQTIQRDSWSGEMEHTPLDGKTRIIESHWTLVRDQAGEPTAIIVINLDVTEKKQLEQRSLRSQRLESIGTLAGGIAHDLNNVLTPILMAVRLLQKDRTPAERQSLLETAQSSVERGTALIQQLLTFAGGGPTAKATVELAKVIVEVRSLLEHTLLKSVALLTEVPDNLWKVSGDVTQLSQIIMNLAVNARDAMPSGGTLTISAENITLYRPLPSIPDDIAPGRYVRLTVTDTGTGIPPKILARIFDPFFTTKEFGRGTGLGLSTVLGIARGHGGAVNVYSEVNQGTRVAVYLPAFLEAVSPAELKRELESGPIGHDELILLVDDEVPILSTVRMVLESAGYRIVTAHDGSEALKTYSEYLGQIRAVILDMMMPVMDGPTTLVGLAKIDPAARVIAASGLRTAGREFPPGAVPPRAFLQKPYSEEDLLRTLAEVLQ